MPPRTVPNTEARAIAIKRAVIHCLHPSGVRASSLTLQLLADGTVSFTDAGGTEHVLRPAGDLAVLMRAVFPRLHIDWPE